MNIKLEEKYIEFVKRLAEDAGAAAYVGPPFSRICEEAKALHEELLRSGYGK